MNLHECINYKLKIPQSLWLRGGALVSRAESPGFFFVAFSSPREQNNFSAFSLPHETESRKLV